MNTILAFLFAIAILVVVHEFGHYWVARRCGVKVLRFSVGFGKPLFVKRLGADQTEWVLSLIPLGGYVKMLDERETEIPIAPEELPRAFNRQPVAKRIAIVAAGPLANFLLALLFYAMINWVGFQAPEPRMNMPLEHSPVALQMGAEDVTGAMVQLINERSVRSWDDVQAYLAEAAADQMPVTIQLITRQQKEIRIVVPTTTVVLDETQPDAATQLGLRPAQEVPVIMAVEPNGPAYTCGMQVGDRVLRANGVPLSSAEQLRKIIESSAGKNLQFELLREKESAICQVMPRVQQDAAGNEIGKIGVAIPPQYRLITIRYGLTDAFVHAAKQLKQMTWFSLRMLWKMVTGSLSLSHLSGPITIADYAGKTAEIGWVAYVNFLALISLSLGVLNLLPVPMLDGGHLLYYLAEIIRGRELSLRVQEIGQRIGLALLLMLMSVALLNDVLRLMR